MSITYLKKATKTPETEADNARKVVEEMLRSYVDALHTDFQIRSLSRRQSCCADHGKPQNFLDR